MTSSYPGAIDALTNPASTDTQSAVPHAAQHANANDAIEAIETFVGVAGSTDPASIEKRLIDVTAAAASGLSEAAADIRYAPIAHGVTGGDAHNHDGGDGAQVAYASLSGLPTLGSAAAAATTAFEASGAVSTHNAVTTAHGISAWGATLVDDADASAARSTLGLGTAATTASTAYATATQGSNADSHAGDTSNPHSVTAAQVGAPTGSGTSTGTNTGDSATPAETTTSIGALLNGATSKTTPVDADRVGLWNSVSGLLEYLSWANLKTALSGLYVLLAGKAGGQTIIGGTGAGDNLSLQSTSHATKGKILLSAGSAYDSVNERMGVGTTSPVKPIEVYGTSPTIRLSSSKDGNWTAGTEEVGALEFYSSDASSVGAGVKGAVKLVSNDTSGARTDLRLSASSASTNDQEVMRLIGDGTKVSIGGVTAAAKLDIWDGNVGLLVGADNAAATRTDATVKTARLAAPHYTNAQSAIGVFFSHSGPGYNNLHFGGGSSALTAATSVNFYAAPNATTTTGTLQATINSNGLGVGTGTPSAKLHTVSTTKQLRLEYGAGTYFDVTANSSGVSRIELVGTTPSIVHAVSDATTNAIYTVSTLAKNATGAGAAGLGVRQVLAAKSSTTDDVQQAAVSSEWLVATHATRTVRGEFGGWDYSGYRAGFRFEADGTQIKTSVNGVAAVARAAALTAEIPGDATRDELRLTELYNACKNFGIIN